MDGIEEDTDHAKGSSVAAEVSTDHATAIPCDRYVRFLFFFLVVVVPGERVGWDAH